MGLGLRFLQLSIILWTCLWYGVQGALRASGHPTVTIDAGVVVGTSTPVPSGKATVNEFLGIPFAVSPPERFSPPQRVGKFPGPVNAQALSPACIQQFVYPEASRNLTIAVFASPQRPESEDCLYLNVYAPNNPKTGKPVMFWIYGGVLQFGDAGSPYYNGSSFAANQDVIVVTANYRTNVFGFSNSPELPLTSINAGFLDQRLALDWVQRNIARFGGDPGKVTIFGESSGASSVDRLVTTFAENPPFRAAITESGQASVSPAPNDGGAASWASLVKALNCTAAASQLACVRAADALVIKNIIEQQILSFSPVTDNVTQRATALLNATLAHQIAQVPYMTGTNGQEGRSFVVNMTNLTAFVEEIFLESTTLQELVVASYPVDQSDATATYYTISQIFTEYIFQCPAALVAKTHAAAGLPTFRYFYNASLSNLQPIPGVNWAAYHSSEIPLVFGTYPTTGPTERQTVLSSYMQTAWADFAKDPSNGPGWAPVTPNGGSDVQNIGSGGSSGGVLISEAEIDPRCFLYQEIYDAVTVPAFK